MLRHTPSDISRTFWRSREDKTDSETFSGHCRTFSYPSLPLFLGACCAHLLARPDCILCLCLMWVWFVTDTATATAGTATTTDISESYTQLLLWAPPVCLACCLAQRAFKNVSFFPGNASNLPWKSISIVYTIHLFCFPLFPFPFLPSLALYLLLNKVQIIAAPSRC